MSMSALNASSAASQAGAFSRLSASDGEDAGVADLQSRCSSLPSALGGGSSKLGGFLQALSGRLGAANAGGSLSSSGKLVNTTA
ncbi:MAG: hypothetical protein RR376_06390 [Janthinobacterium sp.]